MVKQEEKRKYIRQVGKNLPVVVRKRLAAELEESIEDFLESHENAGMQEIVGHFGEPAQFADEYWLSIDVQERSKLFSSVKLRKRILVVCAVVFVLIIGIASVAIVARNARSAGFAYYYELITDSNSESIITDQ